MTSRYPLGWLSVFVDAMMATFFKALYGYITPNSALKFALFYPLITQHG